ncbi:MAG: sodium-dependent transporter, partial [Oceanisphaera sp.]|nr:sodium-dependent transporter [Oceanisphaera sp.]
IGGWWTICIKFVSIGILVVILFNNILSAFRENYGGYSDNDVTFIGWGMIALMLVVAIIINLSSKKETTA